MCSYRFVVKDQSFDFFKSTIVLKVHLINGTTKFKSTYLFVVNNLKDMIIYNHITAMMMGEGQKISVW